MVPMAIDLWGLQAFFVHGLNSSGEDWKSKEFQAVKETLKSLTNNTSEFSSEFTWRSSWINRGPHQRAKAAHELVDFVLTNNDANEEITLVGVSDGGNVAIQAADIFYKEFDIMVNIITLNTAGTSVPGSIENPNEVSGINDMIQFSTEGDPVILDIAGAEQNPGTNENWASYILKATAEGNASHATKNANIEQIKKTEIEKLDKVPSNCCGNNK